MIRQSLLLSCLLCFNPVHAITCYMTIAKDSCWSKYDVEVDVKDSVSNDLLTTIKIPKGQQWSRQVFPCKEKETIYYIARFSPVFWKSDEGKSYTATNSTSLPLTVNPGDKAWNVSICFPKEFPSVPFPPDAHGHCSCDFDSIPAINLK